MRRFGWDRWLIGGVLIVAAAGTAWVGRQEMQTSWLQAGFLTKYGEKLTYQVNPVRATSSNIRRKGRITSGLAIPRSQKPLSP